MVKAKPTPVDLYVKGKITMTEVFRRIDKEVGAEIKALMPIWRRNYEREKARNAKAV
ncbi:MAG: hypothetical protein V1928_02780 [Parcubacteria group bacterium]